MDFAVLEAALCQAMIFHNFVDFYNELRQFKDVNFGINFEFVLMVA